MCYYRLFIFLGCGHSTASRKPIRLCAAARSKRKAGTQARDSEEHTVGESSGKPGILPGADNAGTEEREPSNDDRPTNPHTEDANIPDLAVSGTSSPSPTPEENGKQFNCTIKSTHPYQSLKIYTSCALCHHNRQALLSDLHARNEVRIEDWRWKVKYLSPVPEEARYAAEWSGVGAVMGSWVQDWKTKGDGLLAALRETGEQDFSGKESGRRREDVGRVGYRGGLPSS